MLAVPMAVVMSLTYTMPNAQAVEPALVEIPVELQTISALTIATDASVTPIERGSYGVTAAPPSLVWPVPADSRRADGFGARGGSHEGADINPPAGTPIVAIAAGDPELLSWVHVVFTDAFLRCHETWGDAIPGGADRYVREWAKAGELVGVVDPPTSEAQLRSQLDAFRDAGILKSDERVAEAVSFIRNPPLSRGMLPAYRIMFAGAVATLPEEYRRMLGLRAPRWPAVWATGVVLRLVRVLLGKSSSSEDAARVRIARIDGARAAG